MSLAGFTLVEVLISIVLITTGVTAIIWAFSSGIFVNSDLENIDSAMNIARSRMEQLRNTAFINLTDSPPAADTDFPGFFTAVDVEEGRDPMRIDVIVAWNTKGGQANVTLTTLRADY